MSKFPFELLIFIDFLPHSFYLQFAHVQLQIDLFFTSDRVRERERKNKHYFLVYVYRYNKSNWCCCKAFQFGRCHLGGTALWWRYFGVAVVFVSFILVQINSVFSLLLFLFLFICLSVAKKLFEILKIYGCKTETFKTRSPLNLSLWFNCSNGRASWHSAVLRMRSRLAHLYR